MKTLLLLLSEQHIPNLQSVKMIIPDRIVFVETEYVKQNNIRKHFIDTLSISGISPTEGFDHITVNDENSFNETKKRLETIKEHCKHDDIVVNITGGTKIMALATFEVFKDVAKSIIYKPLREKYFIDVLNDAKIEVTKNINIREFLRGYGFEVYCNTNPDKYNQKEMLYPLATYIAANISNRDIQGFLGKIKYLEIVKKPRNELVIEESDKVFINDITLKKFMIGQLGMNNGSENHLHGIIKPDVMKFLTGGWLEIFFFALFSKYSEELGINDIIMNANIIKAGERNVRNEADILFMKNDMLFMVECKTGKQEHDEKATGTLYKIEAVTKMLGANKVKSILVSTSENIQYSETDTKKHLLSRAKTYNCSIINKANIIELAKMELKNENTVTKLQELLN